VTEQRSGFAVGLTVFAATMMILVGVLHAVQGVVAIANDTFYVAGREWIFELDVTTWGWIQLSMLGFTPRPHYIAFRCMFCRKEVGRSRDPRLLDGDATKAAA